MRFSIEYLNFIAKSDNAKEFSEYCNNNPTSFKLRRLKKKGYDIKTKENFNFIVDYMSGVNIVKVKKTGEFDFKYTPKNKINIS